MKHITILQLIILCSITCAAHSVSAMLPVPEKDVTWQALVESARTQPENNRPLITRILTTYPEFNEALFHTMLYSPTVFPHSALWILGHCIDCCMLRKTTSKLIPRTIAQQSTFAQLIMSLEAMHKNAVEQIAACHHYQSRAAEALRYWQARETCTQNLSQKLEKLLLQSIDDEEDTQSQDHIIWINDTSHTQKDETDNAICLNPLLAHLAGTKRTPNPIIKD